MRPALALSPFLAAILACGASHDTEGSLTPLDSGSDGSGDGDSGRVCNPLDPPVCDGPTSVKTCLADGSALVTTPCGGGAPCKAGVCGCVPKSTTCKGSDVLVCGSDGEYVPGFSCPKGTVCLKGHCDDTRCPDEASGGVKQFSLPVNAWPRIRHDNRNSGWTQAIVADLPKLKWKVFVGGTDYDAQKGLASGPVVNQDNIVFVGAGELDGKNGQHYSFDAAGKKLWEYAANRKTGLSTPVVRGDGTSYVASGGMELLAIKPDGTLDWKYLTAAGTDGDPVVTREGTIVYPSEEGAVYAFEPTGKLIWKSDIATGPGHADAAMAQSCTGSLVVGGENGFVALDVKTGKPQWKLPVTGMYQAVSSTAVLSAEGTMYGVDGGGVGYAVDVATGKVLWSRAMASGGASCFARIGGTLFVVLIDGKLHAVDAGTGAELWSQPVGYSLTRPVGRISGPVIDGNMRIYINSTDGFVYAFDTTGKQLFRIAASGAARAQLFSGTIAIGYDGTLYVPGNDGYLYAFQ